MLYVCLLILLVPLRCVETMGAFHLMAWPVRPDSFLCINGKIWSMFLKYLAKMDLILMLSKFSGQIGPKPKRFVFHSTIWPFWPC
jgi:hypothetical protein